jgi:hypothetical protein
MEQAVALKYPGFVDNFIVDYTAKRRLMRKKGVAGGVLQATPAKHPHI